MCGGPSQQEKNLEQQQASFSQTLQQDYQTTFAQNQQILQSLNAALQPTIAAGPNQQGFSAAENNALNTQAIESNARGVNQVEQAAAAKENAAGGGRAFLPSGVNAQINAGIENAAEQNLSQEELGITEQNYATGRANYQTALAEEQGVAGQYNPLGYAGAGTSANSSAFNEAHTINEESNALFSSILGGITGAVPGLAGTASSVISAVNPNADTGFLDALSG